MALIQQFRPATTVVFRVFRQWIDTGQNLLPVFGPGAPDVGSPEYHAERGYTPTGEKIDTSVIDYVQQPAIAVNAGSNYISSSTQSGVGSSLPSKPKTPGKSYKPGKGKKCRPGYQLINGMCVLRKKRK